MSKTITELEKESNLWKTKYEKCNRSLLEMADEVSPLSLLVLLFMIIVY